MRQCRDYPAPRVAVCSADGRGHAANGQRAQHRLRHPCPAPATMSSPLRRVGVACASARGAVNTGALERSSCVASRAADGTSDPRPTLCEYSEKPKTPIATATATPTTRPERLRVRLDGRASRSRDAIDRELPGRRTLVARFLPSLFNSTSNESVSCRRGAFPSRGKAEAWTNTSSPPSVGVMKPKPRSSFHLESLPSKRTTPPAFFQTASVRRYGIVARADARRVVRPAVTKTAHHVPSGVRSIPCR